MNIRFFGIMAALLLSAGAASAITIQDEILVNQTFTGTSPVFTRTFDISDDPNFVSGGILSATASFTFRDDDGDNEVVQITFSAGGGTFVSENQIGVNETRTTPATDVPGAVLVDLSDGTATFSFDVNGNASRDAVFVSAILNATFADAENPVPDSGSSVALLGLGLCGVAGLKRRFARK